MAATVLILALAAFAGMCTAAPNRIVGGQITSIEQYPSLVQVEYIMTWWWYHHCSGNLLNEEYFLSAAHCFTGLGYQPENRRIRLGSSVIERGGTIVYIVKEYNHPTYQGLVTGQNDGDITVVHLAERVQYSTVIQPVPIIGPGFQINHNFPVVHAGWGAINADGAGGMLLRNVTINVIDRQFCAERYATGTPYLNVTENMICAGVYGVGGQDACYGDTGGPMYFSDILIGVISWTRCGDPFNPSVSTAVSPYTEWILSTAV